MTDEKPAAQKESPLESWKEIAAYLRRDVRTVKRWEKSEGLPVHRHQHQARSSVYGYPSELEAWRANRDLPKEGPERMPWRQPAPALAMVATLLLALVTVASGLLVHPPGTAAQEGRGIVARQLLAGPLVDLTGSISPDGKYLTFVDWETGDLALHDLVTGQNRRLTNKGSWYDSVEFAYFSTPSPDGKQIAYAWATKDLWELRVIGLDGSKPRTLVRNEEEFVYPLTPFEWSRDGEYLVGTFSRKDNTNRIVLISVADGSVRVLKTLDWRYPLKMSLSPDGRFIVYDFPPQENSPNRDIFLLAADGSRETPLVQHPANDLVPFWTPDASRVLFASDRTGGMALWGLSVKEGKPAGSPELLRPDVGRILPLGFTENGSFYYGLNAGMTDVYVAELDLATGTVLSPPVPVAPRYVGSNTSPDWSLDGNFLIYQSERGLVPGEGIGSAVVIRSLATGEERELIPMLTRFRKPRWSPDGRSVVAVGRDARGREGLYLIEVETGKATRVVASEPGTYVDFPAWSPEGKSIWYRGKDGKPTRHDLPTGRDTALMLKGIDPTGLSLQDLAVSPDGQWLAVALFDQTTRATRLMVIAIAGGESRELLRVKAPEFIPSYSALAWTPDGQHILFTKWKFDDLDRPSGLWRISAQGGEPRPVDLTMKRLGRFRVHPDGRRLAFSAGQRKVEIWVLENFLPTQVASE